MKLEYINGPEVLFSPRFEEDDEIMGANASGIITPDVTKYALNVDSPRGKYLGEHPKTHTIMLQKIFGRNNLDSATSFRVIRVTARIIFDMEIRDWKRQIVFEIPKILTPYELKELETEIQNLKSLKSKDIAIGGIIMDVDPREANSNKILNDKTNCSYYGTKFQETESIEDMLNILRENVVHEGYTLPNTNPNTNPRWKKEGER